MDVFSFRTEIRQLIELRQEGEYWDFKKEWYQNKSDLLHDIICMANNLSNHDGLIIVGVDEETDYSICDVINDQNRRKRKILLRFCERKICRRYSPNGICPTTHFWKKDNRCYCYS